MRVGEQRLEYVWHGPPPDSAPVLVFLHEGLGSAAMWRDFPQRVAETTGCGALVYSRAGYGNSDPVQLPRPARFMHDEALITLPKVLEAMEIREAILVGHSDGGSIALIYAGAIASKALLGLMLEAPHVFVEDLCISSINALEEDYRVGELRRGLERYHGDRVDDTFNGWKEVWLNPEFRSWNIEEYLPGIRVPMLLIQGRDDKYGTLDQVRAIERGSGGAVQTVILENCGHDPHAEQPERALAEMTAFISRLCGEEI